MKTLLEYFFCPLLSEPQSILNKTMKRGKRLHGHQIFFLCTLPFLISVLNLSFPRLLGKKKPKVKHCKIGRHSGDIFASGCAEMDPSDSFGWVGCSGFRCSP